MSETPRSAYFTWNDALAARFFCPEAAGQPVYLFVTNDVVREVGRPLGGGVDEFLAAVRAGPPGTTRAGHCQRALQLAARWRERGLRYPPYIAYLSLFVLAGGHEGEFDPRDYYPRLWALLGEREDGTLPSFDRMFELWDDLEKWSVHDMDGTLGLFEARIVGGKIHIGLPLAQTMLTEEERRALPRIFAEAGLDPGSLPSERELRRALAVHGRSILRRRTVASLEGGSASFVTALLDVVSDDFLDWDGEVPEGPSRPGARREVRAGLRLCLSVDRVSRSARPTLRCRSKREFPEAGLEFNAPSISGALTCEEFLPGWSHPLASAETGAVFTPPASAWDAGLTLTDPRAGWTVRLQRAGLRAFVDGDTEQLPGLVETLELPRNQPFYLAFRGTAWPTLEPWITADCKGWRPIELVSGLPSGWMFGSIQEATTDRGTHALDNRLAFPDRRTLRFVGGIRGAVRNTFFSFAPPRVVLDGSMPGDTVVCNGEPLSEDGTIDGSYALPAALPVDTRIGVEARHGDEVIKRRSLYLVSGVPWQSATPLAALDGYGNPAPAGEEGIAGAAVPGAPGTRLPVDPLRVPGLRAGAARVYFVGRTPGQIVVWPAEPVPDWQPVWAVPFGRRGRALFCGTSLDNAAPAAGRAGGRRRVKLWHSVLWRSRARITPPREPALKALWRRYREAARSA